MIISIKDLFTKYTKLEPPEKHIKEALVQAVLHCTNHSISVSEIKIQNSTAFILSHPLLKKEILEQSSQILNEVEKLLSKKTLTSIR